MNRPPRRWVRTILVGMFAVTGCRETLEPAARPAQAVPTDRYLTQVVVAPTATPERWLARISLTGGAATSRMAGFRARLIVPPMLTIDGDVTDQRGALGSMLRVVRVDGESVHATGASADGMPIGDLFVVTVRGPASALAQLRVELEELVDIRGENRLNRVMIAPQVNDARVRR